MLENLNLKNILFIDIETVPQYRNHEELPKPFVELWGKKCSTFKWTKDESPAECYPRAGIYAEFGKVICISCGYFHKDETFHIKSFFGHDEKIILSEFSSLLNRFCNSNEKLLCGHNGKEFDFPFLSRRLIINNLPLPSILNTPGKKPWEVSHLDTMELWKFGDYKSFTSLNLLAAIFNIPTPKDDIDGSMVYKVYWEDNDIERIASYCEKDVLTVARILQRFRNEEFILSDDVVFSLSNEFV